MKMKWYDLKEKVELAIRLNNGYALGAFGWIATDAMKKRMLQNKNNEEFRSDIMKAPSNSFFFDCVCLFKAILWGWFGDVKSNYGGAVYKSNGVPDINSTVFGSAKHLVSVETDFSKIKEGDFVFMKGHMGVYVGNGLVYECTPSKNVGHKKGGVLVTKLNERVWVHFGRSIYVDYSDLDKNVNVSGKIEVGSVVKIKSGSKYQGSALGKPVSPYALKGEWKIKQINNTLKTALLEQINSWVLIKDIYLVGEDGVLKVGDSVKIKSGSKYQGNDKGKPVSEYALKGTWEIKQINLSKGVALLGGINSWLLLSDLRK